MQASVGEEAWKMLHGLQDMAACSSSQGNKNASLTRKSALCSVVLIRTTGSTHSVQMDQRMIVLKTTVRYKFCGSR